MNKKSYHPRQPYSPDKVRRPRRPVHKSWLPRWIAKQPLVQKFSRLSRRRKIILIGWTGTSTLVILGLFTTIYFANTLGSKERIMNRNKTGVTLLDQNNKQFYSFYNAHSTTYVPFTNIAPVAKQAVIASEDKDFYNHPGFSISGILGAVWQNVRPGGLDNGGSTITQQLVKTALLSEERSYIRKYQELILSVEIERRYSKDEILEMYLNSVYFGEGAFGIENAAQIYFGTSAANLNEAQASLLIGLLPSPSAYSPISGDAEKAKVRQRYVLSRMEEDGYINEAAQTAIAEAPLAYSTARANQDFAAPHFALMVKEELEERYGEEKVARSGYTVGTTLNLDWQTAAEKAVAAQVNRLARSSVSNGSAVVLDPKTSEIRALVGSKDWNNEQFGKLNIAAATRQPGSSFKPIVYATGIENRNYSAATIFQDKATDFGGYRPQNYDRRFRGDVTLRRALANSLNVPAVTALQRAGIPEAINTAEALGLSTLEEDDNYGLALALGAAPAKLTELTNAYATWANQGRHNGLATIASITDKNNKQIHAYKPENNRVISDQTSYIISSILSDNAARGETFGSSLTLSGNRPAAVKTGTTEDYRDAWTIGYTPSLAIGVWIGNNDNSPMSSVAGASGAAPIWKTLMQELLRGSTAEKFTQPSSLSVRSICRSNGALAETNGNNTITEYFRPGTLPTARCNESKREAPEAPAPAKPEEENDSPESNEGQGNGNGSGNGNNNPNEGTGNDQGEEDNNPGGTPQNPIPPNQPNP